MTLIWQSYVIMLTMDFIKQATHKQDMCLKNTINVSIITYVTQKMHKTDLHQYTAYL